MRSFLQPRPDYVDERMPLPRLAAAAFGGFGGQSESVVGDVFDQPVTTAATGGLLVNGVAVPRTYSSGGVVAVPASSRHRSPSPDCSSAGESDEAATQ